MPSSPAALGRRGQRHAVGPSGNLAALVVHSDYEMPNAFGGSQVIKRHQRSKATGSSTTNSGDPDLASPSRLDKHDESVIVAAST